MPTRVPTPISIAHDIRYALRGLRNAPGYAVTVILTLALGLGATTAMLAVVDSVLLQPVALPHARQLVAVEQTHGSEVKNYFGYQDVRRIAQATPGLSSIASYTSMPEAIVTPSGARMTGAIHVSTDFFQFLGAPVRMGRAFAPSDLGAPVAVVTEAFWRDSLHSDPHVIGSTLHAEGRVITIIGVTQAGFTIPPQSFSAPLVVVPFNRNAKGEDLNGMDSVAVLGRLRSGVSRATAQAQAEAEFARIDSNAKDGNRVLLQSFGATLTQAEQPGLLAMLGACLLLLAIACVNSANLQIARGTVRAGEMRVRAALGASRARLLQQTAIESITVSVLGAVFGLLLAWGLVAWARSAYTHRFARFDQLALSPGVFVACGLLAIVAGVLAALAPGLSAARGAQTSLTVQTARTTRRSRLSGALVAAQIALTCVLLATAGLFLRTFQTLEHTPLGFNPHHVTEMALMPIDPAASGDGLKQNYTNLLDRLRALPGVEAATTQTTLPFSNFRLSLNSTMRIVGRPAKKGDNTFLSLIDPGFSRTLGVPVVQGRGFNSGDVAGGDTVGLVNRAFVRQYVPQGSALNKVVEFTSDTKDGSDDRFLKAPVRIVGVMPDEATSEGVSPVEPTIFLNYLQFPATGQPGRIIFGFAPQFAVRSTLPQGTLDREIRSVLKQTVPNLAEMQLQSMEVGMGHALDNQRLGLRLAAGFGLVALLLAAIGIYGVLAYTVAQRTREIGIRMALGSSRRAVVELVLRQAAWMCGGGFVVGLLGVWPAAHAVRSFLVGVPLLDPISLVCVALLMGLLCLAAAAIPARRAASVDPITALRVE